MSSWRDQILKEFTPKVSRLTLVADPDGLLLEEGILEGIRERGFELIPFEDRIAFRYAYESKFRSRWDRGEQTDLVVVLRSQTSDIGWLPYDLFKAGRKLSFNLGEIFPKLSYPVVTALDRGDLDALYEAQEKYAPGQLGDNATKEFALRHVFEIAPELVKQPSDLLRVLLRRHYRGQRIPPIIDERFIYLLRQTDLFNDWPIETVVSDREAFFAFLQERWPIFLDRESEKETSGVGEEKKTYGMAINGPVELPFDHHDVRVYMDNLFVEGLLRPVLHKCAEALSKTWAGIGVLTAPSEDWSRRLEKLIENLMASIPTGDVRYGDWLHFAQGWAEMIFLANKQPEEISEGRAESIKILQSALDIEFTSWISKRYAGLINLPPDPPLMVHHLPRFISRKIADDVNAKVAMVVVDGLSLDQWLVVREALESRQLGFRYREQAVFAWIPTLTSVSRQATFAGKPPIFFPNSIQTTDKEPTLWFQFWADHGLSPNEVIYVKGLGDGDMGNLPDYISQSKTRIAGLVIDKVDKIMHGMELGSAGMHNQVNQWARQPFLANLLTLLVDNGFNVYLTSDHGNIEAEGCGRPSEGAMADLRGERVRIYPDKTLRERVMKEFAGTLEWGSIGLPDGYFPLLANGRQAFTQKNTWLVSHGGISVEEIIVPFIGIEREKA